MRECPYDFEHHAKGHKRDASNVLPVSPSCWLLSRIAICQETYAVTKSIDNLLLQGKRIGTSGERNGRKTYNDISVRSIAAGR